MKLSEDVTRRRLSLALVTMFLIPAAARVGAAATDAIFLPTPGNAEAVTIARGTGGSIHAAYRSFDLATPGAQYAFCAAACDNAANWSVLGIGAIGPFGGAVRLVLTPDGYPRMMWLRDTDVGSTYQYAECNAADCTNIANWTQGSVATRTYGSYFRHTRYFALDPQGRPRFLYNDGAVGGGTFYYFCDAADCTLAANWQQTQISPDNLDMYSLVFDALSYPRLAYADFNGSSGFMGYATCDSNCGSSANWTSTPLYLLGGGGAVALRLDSNGRPRIAFYQGSMPGQAGDRLLAYAWCDGPDCTLGGNWTAFDSGFPPEHGRDVDLVLDANQRPRLAYYADAEPFGMVYAECTANCQSVSVLPTWESTYVETSADLQASNPVPPKPGCSLSVWFPGEQPSLVLDAAGNPLFGYDARHAQGGGSCSAHDDIKLLRVAGAKPPGSRLGQGGADWDADIKSDIAVYHPPSGLWYIRQSATGATLTVGYGGTGYTPVPADYDVDGKADIAVYHPSSGLWFVRPSSWNPSGTFTLAFGGSGYKPVPADYDWDGRADFAVYHPPSGLWYIQQSTTLTTVSTTLGGSGFDPVPKDYDGDGSTDVAVYNPTSGQWFIRQSSTGTNVSIIFGGSGYLPVPRDYDGDGKADIAVFHPASGLWFIRQSSTGTDINVGYGSSAYTPVPADYDGDGKADIAVYHEPSGLWFIRQSTTGTTLTIGYGGSGFKPINN